MLKMKKKLFVIIVFLIGFLDGSQKVFSCYRDVPSMPLHRDEVKRKNWIGLYRKKKHFYLFYVISTFILDRRFVVRGCSISQNRCFAMFEHNGRQQ